MVRTHAHARLATEIESRPDAPPRSRLGTLRSDWPLMLRSTLGGTPCVLDDWLARGAAPAQVHLASAGAGPVGGDQLRLEISVGAGSGLVLGEVSPSLLLPGPHGEESCTRIDIAVGPGATLAWLPQLVIAARGCRHRTDIRATVAPGARLLLREETLFGRHGEHPGSLSQRVRVNVGDRPLYDQELVVGPEAPGWSGPAVTGGHRSTGNVILVDAELPGGTRDGDCRTDSTSARATLALPGPGMLVSALAADTASLREQLDAALADLLTAPSRPPAQERDDRRGRSEAPARSKGSESPLSRW